MTQEEKARAYDAQQLVNTFNLIYRPGSKVQHRTYSNKEYEHHTVSSPAFVNNSHQPVAFFDEISGYCSIERDFVRYP